MDKTEEFLREAKLPNVFGRREPVSAGLFSEKRDFLILTHGGLKEYAMFVGARDYGRDLDVSWFMTVNPGFLKRAISKRLAMGDPNALSPPLGLTKCASSCKRTCL
jgi:hypothetical protein